MRDVPAIWAAWRSGVYVGDTRPSTRVTVERNWRLQQTGVVVGTWNRGPARWYQKEIPTQEETEIPNITSVNISRSVDTDAGTCEIIVHNSQMANYGDIEVPYGQFGLSGFFTWDHGIAQDAKARWGHAVNAWNEVLVPNALLRTYQGFGGTDLPIADAVAAGNLVLNGVWLVDDVVVNTDGTLNLKCRDMGKLLVDQQLFPPLVPASLYPLDYRRWIYKTVQIPGDPAPPGDHCFACNYLSSSTDAVYGEWNTAATGHPGTDAFDISPEPGPDIPGAYAHQRSFWLSEPKGDPNDTVWIEFNVNGGNAGLVNEIYYHPWKGVIEGHGTNRIMVSIWENGVWVPPETDLGGMTPDGIPYVCTFIPGTELAPATSSQKHPLPRDFQATRVRLTCTSLIWADDFPYGYGDPDYHGGGFRAGARKIMACFSTIAGEAQMPTSVFASAAIPVNNENRLGYWQVRACGQVWAFGDARVYDPNSPASCPASTVLGMAAHPDGAGYWIVDATGRVVSAGSATHHGDLYGGGAEDIVDIAATPSGNGYWILRSNGLIYTFGDAGDYGSSSHSATMPSGAPAIARSIESHPTTPGYWIAWIDGYVSCHNLPDYGSAYDRSGFALGEYVTSIRRTSTGAGYWVTSGLGHVQAFGDATWFGNADLTGYDGDRWFKGLCWDLVPSSADDNGYLIQSADGKLWRKGDPGRYFGSIGDGTVTQRFDGNYRDYSDVIRDLVLWGGFNLRKDPQPTNEAPDVYGNIETTGAYADDPLAKDIFDKRPIMEAIRQIRDIVGYAAFVDCEGGFRWESPNFWTIGNYLIDGTPLSYMPEIDETVQLTQHSVTRSASQARSKIVISTQDPYPTIPGEQTPKGVVTTEIVPRTASDLRGLLVPAMWINGKFLKKNEQKVMADLIDMRTWFARRMASVSCVANPLIDVNDQIRVIERQSGEVYIHYVKGLNISHDLQSGDFRMTLDTYWLGGTPYGRLSIFFTGTMRPQGDGYWTVTLGGKDVEQGTVTRAYGAAYLYDCNEDDRHNEFIMAMRSTPTGEGYYTMDETGKILSWGDAVHRGALSRTEKDVIDFALTPSGNGYWVLQKTGAVTCYGDAVDYGSAVPAGVLPSGADVFAIAIESHPSTQGYWVLLTDGSVQAFNLTHHGNATRDGFGSHDHTPCLRRTPTGSGYFILAAGGIVQAFGDAVWQGNAPPTTSLNEWFYTIMWEIMPDNNGGYGLLRADGTIEPFNFTIQPSAAESPDSVMWALVAPEEYNQLADKTIAYCVSADVMEFLGKTASPSGNVAVVNNFAAPSESVVKGSAP